MARKIYRGYARDGNGTILSSATIYVYLTGTTTAASIYTASSGGTAVNSVTSDSTGLYKFYTDYSDYTAGTQFRLVISKTGYDSVTYDEVECLNPTYSTDGTLGGNSDTEFPSEKAVKTYVDTAAAVAAAAVISNTAYNSSSWDNVTTIAPSKNAIRDYLVTLGTAAFLNVGTSASQIVQLDGSAKIPAVDGSQLTNLDAGDMLYSDTRFAVEVATRSTATASGDVNYTGAGFTPTAIIVIGGDPGAVGYEACQGFGTGAASQACFTTDNARALIGHSDKVFFFEEVSGPGKQQYAAIAAFLSNGVTLTWTKVGSPSTVDLTLYIFYMR